jgi:hypothetical protein
MTFINAGFPPINYCLDNSKEKSSKQREYSTDIKSNINIIELLSDNKKKPLINITNDVDIEEVYEI